MTKLEQLLETARIHIDGGPVPAAEARAALDEAELLAADLLAALAGVLESGDDDVRNAAHAAVGRARGAPP